MEEFRIYRKKVHSNTRKEMLGANHIVQIKHIVQSLLGQK